MDQKTASKTPCLIVQGDRSVLVEVAAPGFEEARNFLARFAELEKAPEHIHFFRISALSIWNAASAGMELEELLEGLAARSRFPLPPNLVSEIRDWYRRYGLLRLEREGDLLLLRSQDEELLGELVGAESVSKYLRDGREGGFLVEEGDRGNLKQALIQLGYPVLDLGGYREGARLPDFGFREEMAQGGRFSLRPYQREAAQLFYAGGAATGGSGVIVLPCGAGKTIVGMAVMDLLKTWTLILTTNTVAVRQWKRELLDKTSLGEEDIGEYTGERKEIRPVTIATYQILTYRKEKEGEFEHFHLFGDRDWGLLIYDEVHLLPAPVFRATAEIQARRRLGLTATLVREDHKETDVFSLIGPKRYDVPWRELESGGHIAKASCVEIRVPIEGEERRCYLQASPRNAFRLASTNSRKLEALKELLQAHKGDRVLIIGQYLDQLERIRADLGIPMITGKTSTQSREKLYMAFRKGELRVLGVSKVGNFAVDLPDANVAIQVSGSFGSRQEEAQRLGRILRPKSDGSEAVFYALVSAGTVDQEFAAKRQRFLAEQGYGYRIEEWRANREGVEG